MEDRCVMCGEVVPEGRLVCPLCERKTYDKHKKTLQEKLVSKLIRSRGTAKHPHDIDDAIDYINDSVPLKPLCEWLAGYASPPGIKSPNSMYGSVSKAWEAVLRRVINDG